ncbi:MAG TPA: OmpH family outer membrane protein [Sphingobacteriaceae bacterium]|nr:OmpH family outer membrane protein [Sphingobacteriaceae bacterium]
MNSMRNVLKSLAVVAALFLTVGSVSAQQKIGHINYAEIFTATADYLKAEEELKALDSVKTGELQSMFNEYQKKRSEAQDMLMNRSEANKAEIDPQLQALDIEIQDFERRLQEVQQIAEQEIGQKQQELFTPIHQKVGTAIQSVAAEKGYAYVFDISSTNIPYFQGGEDITNDIKIKLGIAVD